MGGRRARSLTVDSGERPLQLLPILRPLLIFGRFRQWTRQRVEDAQPRQRQRVIEAVSDAPDEAP